MLNITNYSRFKVKNGFVANLLHVLDHALLLLGHIEHDILGVVELHVLAFAVLALAHDGVKTSGVVHIFGHMGLIEPLDFLVVSEFLDEFLPVVLGSGFADALGADLARGVGLPDSDVGVFAAGKHVVVLVCPANAENPKS